MEEKITLFDGNAEYYEQADYIDKGSAAFRVHASLIYKLGESLIGDDITALSELIKNTYDADASICVVSIDSNCKDCIDGELHTGRIEIRDNGCGMDLSTIINGWLTLSNSVKKQMKKENKTTKKYHRWPLGDKGLGRLSVQKLGRHMEMTTKTSLSDVEYMVVIPWGDFLKNTTIDQIPVKIIEKPVHNNKSYTKIVIRDLVDAEQWSHADKIDVFAGALSKIVSPFRSKDNTFRLLASVNGEPVKVDFEAFEELLRTARAKFAVKYSDGRAVILEEYKSGFFYNQKTAEKMISGNIRFTDTLFDDFFAVHASKLGKLKRVKREGVVFEETDECLFPDIVSVNSKGEKEEHCNPGNFECEIYEYYLDNKFIDSIYEDYEYSSIIDRKEYKKFVDLYHGIKVVRDGFLVQGYGEGDGGDWLGLSSSSKTTGKYFDFRNESVIGCVYLTGEENSALKETTNRQGFVEDEYYKNFRKILDGIIRRLNLNRYKLSETMRKYLMSALDHTGSSIRGEKGFAETADNIRGNIQSAALQMSDYSIRLESARSDLSEVKSMVMRTPDVPEKSIQKIDELSQSLADIERESNAFREQMSFLEKEMDAIQYEFQKMNERLKDLFELAGLGLSVETFTHEFDRSIRSIKMRNKSIVENRTAATTDTLVQHINYVSYALDALRKQMSYFNPGLKFVRAERQVFEIRDFLEEHRTFYVERCKRSQILFELSVETDFMVRINKGMLNQVMDNLFNNSEYWLEFAAKYEHLEKKEYHIEVKEKGYILVWDNGSGIGRDMENRLFEPFESKKQNGRGLGLYIAVSNLQYSNGGIRLLEERNAAGNLYKFEINLLDATQ